MSSVRVRVRVKVRVSDRLMVSFRHFRSTKSTDPHIHILPMAVSIASSVLFLYATSCGLNVAVQHGRVRVRVSIIIRLWLVLGSVPHFRVRVSDSCWECYTHNLAVTYENLHYCSRTVRSKRIINASYNAFLCTNFCGTFPRNLKSKTDNLCLQNKPTHQILARL